MAVEEKPSYDDLMRAWNQAIICAGIGGSGSESLQQLINMRKLKTTWYGKEENDLRFMLDAYIADKGFKP